MFVRYRWLRRALGAASLVISACSPLEHGADVIEPGGDGDGEGDHDPTGDGDADGDWDGASWDPSGGPLAYDPPPDLTCPPVEVDPALRGSACADGSGIARGWPTYVRDAHDLNALSGCTEVEGLVVTAPCLTNLDGLESLTKVQGLGIADNPRLRSLAGLSNVTSVGELWVGDNAVLKDLTGLEKVADAWVLSIQRNPALTNVKALSSVTKASWVDIVDNASLTNLDGLGSLSLQNHDGSTDHTSLWIEGNPALERLTQFTNLDAAYQVLIGDNAALADLDGLEGLHDAFMVVIWANGITNVDGLSGLAAVQQLSISGNPVLTSITGLSSAGFGDDGHLVIDDNAKLASFAGIENLTDRESLGTLWLGGASITTLDAVSPTLDSAYRLQVTGSPKLTDLSGLGGIGSIDDLFIEDNDGLASLSGLDPAALRHLSGLLITGNALLSDLSVLAQLESAHTVHIEGNPALGSLTGLENLLHTEHLKIVDNDALTSLSGLETLSEVTQDVTIAQNPALTSLAGLSGLSTMGSPALDIYDNPALPACEAEALAARVAIECRSCTGNDDQASCL